MSGIPLTTTLGCSFLAWHGNPGKLVATVAKGPSFCVLFHGLDTSRRNASQSSAEACQMQLIEPEGASVKRQYSMPAPLGWRVCTVLIVVLLGDQVPVVCKQILQAVEDVSAASTASSSEAWLPHIWLCSSLSSTRN